MNAREKNHTYVWTKSQGEETTNDWKTTFVHVGWYFYFSFEQSLNSKTSTHAQGTRKYTGKKTIRDALLFTIRDLSPFLGHGPAMGKSQNISFFYLKGTNPKLRDPHSGKGKELEMILKKPA